MWKDVVNFVPDVFSCVDIRIASVQRWIPLSQHIIAIQASVIMRHVANVQEPKVYPPFENSWEQVQPGSLQYSNNVALDEVDRIVRQYHELASKALRIPPLDSAAYPQSPRNMLSPVPAVNAPPISDTPRVFEVEFALASFDELTVMSLELVFTCPGAADSPTPVVEVRDIRLPSPTTITAVRNTLVVHSDIRTSGFLVDITIHGVANHDFVLGVQVYDGVGRTWMRARVALTAHWTKIAYPCTPEEHAMKGFEITSPHDFDLVYTAFQPLMCTGDFGV
jgi:hypothetical protein